jgi:hypothetical protein
LESWTISKIIGFGILFSQKQAVFPRAAKFVQIKKIK